MYFGVHNGSTYSLYMYSKMIIYAHFPLIYIFSQELSPKTETFTSRY